MTGKRVKLAVGGVTLELALPAAVEITESFRPFVRESGEPDVTAVWECVPALPRLDGKAVYCGSSFDVYSTERGFVRAYHEHNEHDNIYAHSVSNGNLVRIFYTEKELLRFSELQNCFYHIALEERVLPFERLVLHASLVDTPYGGILFSGVSGIGKSTQARLWEKHRNALQINGDRPVLGTESGVWYGYGSPYAGSSRCWVDKKSPVRAAVLLAQGEKCEIKRLNGVQAFQRLYAGLTLHSWDAEFMEKACDLLKDLVSKVPVYHLICTPDERAVEALENEIGKGGL